MARACISLETGGLVIGVLEIIVGTVGVIVGVLGLGSWAAVEKEFDKEPRILRHLLSYCYLLLSEDAFTKSHLAVHTIDILIIAFIISAVIQVLVSSALIYGIVKASCRLMLGWVIFKITFLINFAIMLIATSFLGITVQQALIYVSLIGHSLIYLKVIYELKKKIVRLPTNITAQNKL